MFISKKNTGEPARNGREQDQIGRGEGETCGVGVAREEGGRTRGDRNDVK